MHLSIVFTPEQRSQILSLMDVFIPPLAILDKLSSINPTASELRLIRSCSYLKLLDAINK